MKTHKHPLSLGASWRRLALIGAMTSALALSSFQPLQGQKSSYKRNWQIGARGGLNFSRFSFVPSLSQDMYRGEYAGLLTRFEVEKGASLQIELLYSKWGWRERFEDQTLAYSRSMTYVEMPILSQLYLGSKTDAYRAFINLGPVLGYALSEEGQAEGNAFSDRDRQRHAQAVDNKFFWGITVGPGFSLRLARRHRIELEGRYTLGFGDYLPNARTDLYIQSTTYRFSLGLTYLYRL